MGSGCCAQPEAHIDALKAMKERHGNASLSQFAASILVEVEGDEETLRSFAKNIGSGSNVFKEAAAWVLDGSQGKNFIAFPSAHKGICACNLVIKWGGLGLERDHLRRRKASNKSDGRCDMKRVSILAIAFLFRFAGSSWRGPSRFTD